MGGCNEESVSEVFVSVADSVREFETLAKSSTVMLTQEICVLVTEKLSNSLTFGEF